MNIIKRTHTFLNKFKKYMFYYKDGFYVIPYLNDSPQMLIETFKNYPFCKHYEAKRYFTTNNFFNDVTMHYDCIEEEFWVMLSDQKVKKNVKYNMLYDNKDTTKYYSLLFYSSRILVKTADVVVNNIIHFNKSWSLTKPRVEVDAACLKNTHGNYLVLYFSEAWFQKNILAHNPPKALIDFLNSTNNQILFPHTPTALTNDNSFYTNIIQRLENKAEIITTEYLTALKEDAMALLQAFMEQLQNPELEPKHSIIAPTDVIKKVLLAQRYILEIVLEPFPSIETIAAKVDMSPTTFNTWFKTIIGATPYKYYQKQRLLIAKECLEQKTKTVSEVAKMLNYSNQSKFTEAFKNEFDVLPSKIQCV